MNLAYPMLGLRDESITFAWLESVTILIERNVIGATPEYIRILNDAIAEMDKSSLLLSEDELLNELLVWSSAWIASSLPWLSSENRSDMASALQNIRDNVGNFPVSHWALKSPLFQAKDLELS